MSTRFEAAGASGTAGGERSRVALAHLPTPLEPLDRLSEWLGGPRILVKRDDQTGLALGGNKARKLERLCREALDAGADVLVTGGGPQSNHVRTTAAAAARLGLDAHLVLGGDPPAEWSGNLLLDRLLGASIEHSGARDYLAIERTIDDAAARLQREGRRPFAIPVGGASVTGVLAYVEAADELSAQLASLDVRVDAIVVADGSGGTHAGLLAGLGDSLAIVGVDSGTHPDLGRAVPELAARAAAVSGRPPPPSRALVDADHVGEGYGHLTEAAVAAIRTTARLEGLLLDPVYTAKAMAALVTRSRQGRFGRDDTVLFWHTGGAPALFARRYEDDLAAGGR